MIIFPDRAGSADPGTQINYAHTVENLGGTNDSFDITLQSRLNFPASVSPSSVNLTPGQQAPITVSVMVPANALSGIVDTITVTARSPLNGVSDYALDRTTVRQIAGVDIGEAPNFVQAAAPGATVSYNHVVTNTGNAPDSFNISALVVSYSVKDENFSLSLSQTNLNLGPGQTGLVTLSVTVPLTATSGNTAWIEVTAQSTLNAGVNDTAVDGTTVQ